MWQHLAARESGDYILFISTDLCPVKMAGGGAGRKQREGNSQFLAYINSWVMPGEREKRVCRKEGSGRREDADVQKEVRDQVASEWVRERVATWLLTDFLLDSNHMQTDCSFLFSVRCLYIIINYPFYTISNGILFFTTKKKAKTECHKSQA